MLTLLLAVCELAEPQLPSLALSHQIHERHDDQLFLPFLLIITIVHSCHFHYSIRGGAVQNQVSLRVKHNDLRFLGLVADIAC